MKLSLALLALSSSAASAYRVGGFEAYGRPYNVSPGRRFFGRGKVFRNGCVPPGGPCQDADQAFEDLRKEMNNGRYKYRNPGFPGFETKMDEETIRQQEDAINRAFGLASDIAKGFASSPQEVKEADEAIRQQREWVDRAFGLARDVSSGGAYSSVRAEVLQDDDEALQLALDVPGVKAGDVEVTVEGIQDETLVVRGKRNVGKEEESRKFSKSFALDTRSNTNQISAELENGVLLLTIPRVAIKKKESVQKVAVNKGSDETVASSGANAFPFEVELDVPGVSASNIDITIKGNSDKTLTITAVREVGKDIDGNPRKRETSRSYSVDETVDTSKIVANLSNGVLKVSAPANARKTEETVRSIIVNQSSDSRGDEDSSQSVKIANDDTIADGGKRDDQGEIGRAHV